MDDFEKLGAFYLGRTYDLAERRTNPELLLYRSRDLTTHAVCVGMTGSGKTGLCLTLLEEAAIDGIPAIAVDPKGDLGNLLLTFPELRPADFQPWLDPSETQRSGKPAEQQAAETAEKWREGLAEWGQSGERIARFRESVDLALYTPGSSAGLPLTVLKSFAAPPAAIVSDADAFRTRIASAVSGLLALLGIDADPLTSREQILLASLLDRAWRAGRSLEMADLIREIQSPPVDKVGLIDLETFFPAKERFELAMRLNNLLASPGFAGWLEGEPLDIGRLLYTAEGKPRLSILSIAHLADDERMFFVTILLNELLAWMRTQPGTSALRAIFYMDEVFGYFPPSANPPAKTPMLTLLKQARAYGLGVVLATQNPVDLDYKGLSNAGTWFLGRLQTERDKARVLDGLEGASAAAGSRFDRQQLATALAALGNRVFLMNNVHEDEPVVFQTRWTLSYLRGPLTREQISLLTRERRPARKEAAAPPESASPAAPSGPRPVLPPGVVELFWPVQRSRPKETRLIYRPALLGAARMHFTDAKSGTDQWEQVMALGAVGDAMGESPWEGARIETDAAGVEFDAEPEPSAGFAALPAACATSKSYASWGAALKDHLYRERTLGLWKCSGLKRISQLGESKADFVARLALAAREARDAQVEKLQARYAPKLAALTEQIRKAQQRVEREKTQSTQQAVQAAISFGASLLGALLGRKAVSAANMNRAASAARAAGRAARERGDVQLAEETVEALQQRLADLQAEFRQDADKIEAAVRGDALVVEPLDLRAKKSEITVERVALVWRPWFVDAESVAAPAFDEGRPRAPGLSPA